MSIKRQTASFLIIGLIGLAVDMAAYAALNLSLSDNIARIGSIMIAMTATWLLNRNLTFDKLRKKRLLREYSEYVASSIVGAGVNYATFIALNAVLPAFFLSDYLHIAISSATAAIVNFILYKYLVFKDHA